MEDMSMNTSKKFKTLATLLLTVVLVISTACGSNVPGEKEPFTFDTTAANSIANLFDRGSAADLVYSTPFYGGGTLEGQNISSFDKARSAKVDEIFATSQTMGETAVEASNDLSVPRNALLKFCDELDKNGVSEVNVTAVPKTIAAMETVLLQTYASSNAFNEIEGSSEVMIAFVKYLSLCDATEMTDAVLKEAEYILITSALAIEDAQARGNDTIKKAANVLDGEIATYMKASGPELQSLAVQLSTIDYGLRQLETSDYHFTKAVAGFVSLEGQALENQISDTTSNANTDAETLAFLQQYNEFLQLLSQDLVTIATPARDNRLIEVASSDTSGNNVWWIASAYAETADDYGKAVIVLSTDIPDQNKEVKGFFASGWDSFKSGANEFKKAVGVSVDVLGSAVYNQARDYYGKQYGNTTDEIAKDLKDNKLQVIDSFKKGKSGSDTFIAAGGYLEDADKAVGDMVGYVVDKGVNGMKGAASNGIGAPDGKTPTGYVANFLAKTTMGLFTDFGKGVYKVMNTTSTEGEIASGVIDIATSCIGGSTVIFKASALLPGAAKAGVTAGKGALNYVDKKLIKSSLSTLVSGREVFKETTELTAKEIAFAVNREALIRQTSAMMKALETQQKLIRDQFAQILKDGGKFAWMNAKQELKSSLKSTLQMSLKEQMMVTLKALKETPSKSMVNYLDFIVGEVSDNVIKDAVEAYVDRALKPSFSLGEWRGQLTFSKILDPAIGLKSGQSFELYMNLKTLDNGQGNMSFEVSGGGPPLSNDGTFALNVKNFSTELAYSAVIFTLNGTVEDTTITGTFTYSYFISTFNSRLAEGKFTITLM